MLRTLTLAGLALLAAPPLAAQCTERALVSGYYSQVHVFDACSGAFERVLDDAQRIAGPQAVKLGPDGRLYVVSEENGTILRYDAATLAFVDTYISTGATCKPTGLAFGPDGDAYVGCYAADTVRRYDGTTRQLEGVAVAARQGGLDGPDNGLAFGPDGKLYVPGYDSNSVVRYDPATGVVDTPVPSRTGGLSRTRAVLFEPGNQSFLVSSEGNGLILRFNAQTGALAGTFARDLGTPAGMGYRADGKLLVASNNDTVLRVSASNGANEGPLFASGSGGVSGATYVAVIPKAAAAVVDASQVGSQYWVVGAGTLAGRTLDVEVVSATGAAFGAAFRPADVQRKRWGRLRLEFTGCATANFSWQSSGEASAGFGDGGYPIVPAVRTGYTGACESAGFAVAGDDFVNGSWWGGESRNGEGLFVTRAPDGLVAVAFFTHRPAAAATSAD
ncbi:MAG TPA: hypothetical protein VFO79_02875 [Xanthomonadales bacterium]|nr:hypothetical protein [Xanthomonadales bacterium]